MLLYSVAEWLRGVGHLDHVRSYGVREVVSSIPDRGNIVGICRMSFSSDPGDWYGFLIWTCLSFQILNLFRTLSSWGSGNYRPSAPILYEVASHVKNCHSGHYYYYYKSRLKVMCATNIVNVRFVEGNVDRSGNAFIYPQYTRSRLHLWMPRISSSKIIDHYIQLWNHS